MTGCGVPCCGAGVKNFVGRALSLKPWAFSCIVGAFDILEQQIVMNVKISIELPESQLEFAERKVREGGYASVSDVIAETLRDAMWAEEDRARDDPVLAMKDEILRRLALPDDQWITMDEHDTMFEDLEARLKAKFGSVDR